MPTYKGVLSGHPEVEKITVSQYVYRSCANSVTAFAGGGQASATPLPAALNRVTTVATAGDSVMLPVAKAGLKVVVKNTSANSLNVFPAVGDAINALSANAAYAIATVKSAEFYCMVDGTWDTNLSA
jgi:hypothetical protein